MNFVEKRLSELDSTTTSKTEKCPITVKLSGDVINDLNEIASKLEMTRHALIVQMIEHGTVNAKETLEKFQPLYTAN